MPGQSFAVTESGDRTVERCRQRTDGRRRDDQGSRARHLFCARCALRPGPRAEDRGDGVAPRAGRDRVLGAGQFGDDVVTAGQDRLLGGERVESTDPVARRRCAPSERRRRPRHGHVAPSGRRRPGCSLEAPVGPGPRRFRSASTTRPPAPAEGGLTSHPSTRQRPSPATNPPSTGEPSRPVLDGSRGACGRRSHPSSVRGRI